MSVQKLTVLNDIRELKKQMNNSADKVSILEVGLEEWFNSPYLLARGELKKYMMSLKLEDIKYIIILLELGQGGYITDVSNEEVYNALKEDMGTITEKEIRDKIEDMVANSQLWNRLEQGLNILVDLEIENSY